MRGGFPKLLITELLLGAASFHILGHPTEVRAQTALCPPGFTVQNGACTKGADGAFSGAILASQALSELSETSTQETTRNTIKSIVARREQEEWRCAEGFSRVDGICQPVRPRVSEAAPGVPIVAPAPTAPQEERVLKKAKKPKAAAVPRKEAVAPAPKIMRRAPPPPDPPPVSPILLPVPIEPAVRFGTWAQVYGDYEKRDAAGIASVTAIINSGPIGNSVQSRTGTVGFLVGGDLTSRNLVFGNDGLIAGVTVGFVSSNLTLNTSSLSLSGAETNGFSRLHANLSGPTAGLYATYFNGEFSSDLILKFDALSLNESFNDLLGFNTDATTVPLNPFPFAGSGSVGLLNTTIAGNLNYRFALYPNFWVEPTVGAQYTNSRYGSGAAQLGLETGNLVMVQGGARFGTTTLIDNRILMTTTLTGLAYDDVLVAGGFIPAGVFDGQSLLVQSDQGFVRGRGILAFNFDFGDGITSFVQGEVRGGAHLLGAGGKAGVRVQW
jgi:hypothetical protein